MRLTITVELQRESPDDLNIQAEAAHEKPLGRWVAAHLDLRTLITILVFAGSVIALYTQFVSNQAVNLHDQANTDRRLDRLEDAARQSGSGCSPYYLPLQPRKDF